MQLRKGAIETSIKTYLTSMINRDSEKQKLLSSK